MNAGRTILKGCAVLVGLAFLVGWMASLGRRQAVGDAPAQVRKLPVPEEGAAPGDSEKLSDGEALYLTTTKSGMLPARRLLPSPDAGADAGEAPRTPAVR